MAHQVGESQGVGLASFEVEGFGGGIVVGNGETYTSAFAVVGIENDVQGIGGDGALANALLNLHHHLLAVERVVAAHSHGEGEVGVGVRHR